MCKAADTISCYREKQLGDCQSSDRDVILSLLSWNGKGKKYLFCNLNYTGWIQNQLLVFVGFVLHYPFF